MLITEELISLLHNGDEKTFETIFKHWFEKLVNYAYKLIKNDDLASEIVEDFFVYFWENLQKIEINTSLNAYFFKSIHNRCLKEIRHELIKQKYENFTKLSVDNNFYDTEIPISPLLTQELQQKIDFAVNQLPHQCKEIFTLSRFEDLSYKEIAEKLQLSENTVKTQIKRALKKLRTELADYLPSILFLF